MDSSLAEAGAQAPSRALDQLIDSVVESRWNHRSALVVGVHAGGEDVIRGYGAIARNDCRVPDAATIFEIGSITKVFTTLLLAEMAEDGLVGLDDELAAYMPADVRVPLRDGRSIRLVDLATHTAGLPSVPRQIVLNVIAGRRRNPYAGFTSHDLHQALSNTRLRHPPGSRFAYSNMGAALLAEALARRAGMDYAELVEQRVAGPLGMADTTAELSSDQLTRLAQGHSLGGRPRGLWDLAAFAGAGCLRSCAADILAFLRANLDPPLQTALGRAMRLTHVARATVGRHHQIGLGWLISVQPRSLHLIHWHNGGTGGYRSFAGFSVQGQVAVVALAAQARSVDGLCLDLLERLTTKRRTPVLE